jgi:hypothetical protein
VLLATRPRRWGAILHRAGRPPGRRRIRAAGPERTFNDCSSPNLRLRSANRDSGKGAMRQRRAARAAQPVDDGRSTARGLAVARRDVGQSNRESTKCRGRFRGGFGAVWEALWGGKGGAEAALLLCVFHWNAWRARELGRCGRLEVLFLERNRRDKRDDGGVNGRQTG